MQIVEPPGAVALDGRSTSPPRPTRARRRSALVDEQTAAGRSTSPRGPLLRSMPCCSARRRRTTSCRSSFTTSSSTACPRSCSTASWASSTRPTPPGGEPPLAEPAIQYADYAEWQRSSSTSTSGSSASSATGASQLAGSCRRRSSCPPIGPVRRWPACAAPATARRCRGELRGALDALARAEGATFFTAVLAAFDVLLYRYTGQEDLVVGTPVDTRTASRSSAPIDRSVHQHDRDPRRPIRLAQLPRAAAARPGSARSTPSSTRSCPSSGWSRRWPPSVTSAAIRCSRRCSRSTRREGAGAAGRRRCRTSTRAGPRARVDLFLDPRRPPARAWRRSGSTAPTCSTPSTIERMAAHFVRLLEAIVADPGPADRRARRCSASASARAARRVEPRPTATFPQRASSSSSPSRRAHDTRPRGGAVRATRGSPTASWTPAPTSSPTGCGRWGAARTTWWASACPAPRQLLVALLGTLKAGAAYVPIDPASRRRVRRSCSPTRRSVCS